MNVVKDVDYLTRFTIQDLIALLQAEWKMLSPVKRANEDSESGLSPHVGPSSKRVCQRAQRKGNFFSCKEDLDFYVYGLYYSPTRCDPDYPLLPAYEAFLIENFETDPVAQADNKVQSAEEELVSAERLSLRPEPGFISLGGKSFKPKMLHRREVGVQATTREVCSLLPFALFAFLAFQAFVSKYTLSFCFEFPLHLALLLVKRCLFTRSAGRT